MSKLAEVLGVTEGEIFRIKGGNTAYRIKDGARQYRSYTREWKECCDEKTLTKAINSPDVYIVKIYGLSSEETYMLNAAKKLGFTHVKLNEAEEGVESHVTFLVKNGNEVVDSHELPNPERLFEGIEDRSEDYSIDYLLNSAYLLATD
jgi:hypothetical protein